MPTAFDFRKFVRQYLGGTRLFPYLRTVYQAVFNPEYLRFEKARRNFYQQFVSSDSLVFDVGANVGEYTEAFLRLGARVVAVEPNPSCCKRIEELCHETRLSVRCEAMGERQGECMLHVGQYSPHSTVSEEWMETALQNDSNYQWKDTIKTRVNTLDEIKREYGVPDFIKIDVEGYELSVLRGMSFTPRALSFEFHGFTPKQAADCVRLSLFDSGCHFNLALNGTWKFVWSEWRDRDAILEYISSLRSDVFGDIYASFDHPKIEY